MKPEELRFGNYISDVHASKTFFAKVKKLDFTRCYYGDFYSSYKDLSPIPLTEEWFVKFGFEKVGSTNIYFFIPYPNSSTYGHKINVFKYEINEFGLAFSDKLTGRNRDYISATRIKYVHQLQNLYFALTGKELKLSN